MARESEKMRRQADAYEEAMRRQRQAAASPPVKPPGGNPPPTAGQSPSGPLRDPSENRIGKFSGPQAGAPSTQRGAAQLVYPRTGIARERVLTLIIGSADFGVTDEEGMHRLSMAQNTYRPRRNELMNDGWIEDVGIRRNTTSLTPAVAWVLSERAKEQIG
jgi:hypothetical protein